MCVCVQKGIINLKESTTMRSYLAQELHCPAMRISKKYHGNASMGLVRERSCVWSPPPPPYLGVCHFPHPLLAFSAGFRATAAAAALGFPFPATYVNKKYAPGAVSEAASPAPVSGGWLVGSYLLPCSAVS